MAKKRHTIVLNTAHNTGDDFIRTAKSGGDSGLWNWGTDNLFPVHLERLARQNASHRRVMHNKADYMSGNGFAYDERNKRLARIVQQPNRSSSLRELCNRLAYDKVFLGNTFMEVVVNKGVVMLFHQDATRCRISKPNDAGEEWCVIDKDWTNRKTASEIALPLYPKFAEQPDGTSRSIVHCAEYEPTFMHYGVPEYIAGLISAKIGYKTADWNLDRLNNSFQLSGVMELVGGDGTSTDAELAEIGRRAEQKFAGKAGQVLFTVSNEAGEAKFTPIQSNNEGDWTELHTISKNDVVVAHSWFLTLSGLDYSTGFSADRIINEYNVALTTIIEPAQQELLDPIRRVLGDFGIDGTSLEFINKAPIAVKPQYMRVWEARKIDGLEYDENDPAQQVYLANITVKSNNNG